MRFTLSSSLSSSSLSFSSLSFSFVIVLPLCFWWRVRTACKGSGKAIGKAAVAASFLLLLSYLSTRKEQSAVKRSMANTKRSREEESEDVAVGTAQKHVALHSLAPVRSRQELSSSPPATRDHQSSPTSSLTESEKNFSLSSCLQATLQFMRQDAQLRTGLIEKDAEEADLLDPLRSLVSCSTFF